MCDPLWTEYLQAALAPIVAALGIYIAYRQWRTAQNKLKLDLFERRIAIYEVIQGFISSIITSGKTTSEKEYAFLAGTRGAKWVFGEDIAEYIEKELWHNVCELSCLQSELEGFGIGEERANNVRRQREIKEWLVVQQKMIDVKLSSYLSLCH